jgi:hypothetical protein
VTVEPGLKVFRERASLQPEAASWVPVAQQAAVWRHLSCAVTKARAHGLSPVVCVDLDLTTLLAPQKSRDILADLAPSTINFDAIAGSNAGTFSPTLDAIWRGQASALLPGYTTTSIQAYGVYCAAQLQARTGKSIAIEKLSACEEWIATNIHAKLRSGYWDRDLAKDELALGFTAWARMIASSGARIAFLSNRDPSLRQVSLDCIQLLLGKGSQIFAFFGPGGSNFDASSKAAAVAMIETGVSEGVHFGVAQGSRTEYPDAVASGPAQEILAVIDDRAENRLQLIEAASASTGRLSANGLGGVMDIASAALGFCPEVAVAGMANVVSSFIFEETL